MSASYTRRRFAVCLMVLGLLPGVLNTQIAQAAETELTRSLLSKGIDYERGHNWLKAIQHYEKATKDWPESESIRYGLRRSKIHFAIARRYNDRSFESQLLAKSKSESLDLFDDVLTQVRSQYVTPISSTSFVAHGTESLYVALGNNAFTTKHLRGVDQQRIDQLRKTLRDQFWNKPMAHRLAARETVSRVCDLASSTAGLSPSAVVMEYVFGGCNSLDDYSNVLTPHRLEDLYGNIDGEFVGLGIEMKAEHGKGLLLVNVLPNSPAVENGLQRLEHIVEIDGQNCRNMTSDAASKLLRGRSGTSVRLMIQAADSDQTRNRSVVRRAVQVKSIPVAEIIDRQHGIGYIQMNGFQKTTSAELDEALAKLQRSGMKTLIWDLRGNPGGLLNTAVEVLDRFLDNGVLVSTRGRSRDQNWSYSAKQLNTLSIPLILLVDGDSASASEIVAGAIRDHRRGLIVGRQTYGKWSVQSILPMNERMGFRMTTAKFYSPKGNNYSKVGVKPDVVVKDAPESLLRYHAPRSEKELQQDTDLSKAVELLRQRASR